MFTGLIQGQGIVRKVQALGNDMRLAVQSKFSLENIELGESIAVNGVCLTVEQGDTSSFSAFVSAESLKHTNLALLKQGSSVNLERAVAVGQRLGGHIVSGHVDCLGKVARLDNIGQSRCIGIEYPQEYSPEIISKGSITLDGISLTVNACKVGYLEVNVIPETWSVTSIGQWSLETLVNIETDIIGKYVRHMLKPWDNSTATAHKSTVTEQLLQQHGFI